MVTGLFLDGSPSLLGLAAFHPTLDASRLLFMAATFKADVDHSVADDSITMSIIRRRH